MRHTSLSLLRNTSTFFPRLTTITLALPTLILQVHPLPIPSDSPHDKMIVTSQDGDASPTLPIPDPDGLIV